MQFPGQPVGPIEACINCRCVLSIGVEALTAAGGTSGFSGVVIVALPEGDEMITYEDGDTTEMHQTLAYLGTTDQLLEGEREEVIRTVENLASKFQPFTANVAGLGTLGKDQDGIAITESRELQDLHDMALDSPIVDRMYQERNGHPTWISHITAGTLQPGDEVRFDRLGAWFGGDEHITFNMGEAVVAAALENPPVEDDVMEDVIDAEEDVMDDDDLPPIPNPLLTPEDENMPIHGVLAPEGVESGDGRSFKEEATTWRELPLPVSWQRTAVEEHGGSVVTGKITDIWREDNLIHFEAELVVEIPEVDELIGQIADQTAAGVSVDMDQAVVTDVSEGEGEFANPSIEFDGRIAGVTIVAIPAFEEAFLGLGPHPGRQREADEAVEDEALLGEPVTMSLNAEAFKRGSGWVTHPVETRRIHDYWVRGKGAAKVRWGTPGDFTRLRRFLSKYIDPRYLNRTAAQWHHDALGYWPGQCGRPGNPACGAKRGILAAGSKETMSQLPSITIGQTPSNHSHSLNLVAAAPPAVVRMSSFKNPNLAGPTPLTVVGREVFGHIAKWGTCHIGIDKVCVEPPKSKQDYAYFHLGSVVTDEGEIAVGRLTLGTGHADLRLSASATTAHYDNTGTAVAMVRAGEDDHGIWVAGVVCDGVSDEQVRTLMAAGGISGDWRSIGGSLELVAALAVNVPGFPVPRPALAASADRQTSLVAAGVVVVQDDPRIDAIAEAVVAKITASAKRQQKLNDLEPLQAEARARRVAALQDVH